jgi:hypothetical protein
MNKYKPTIKREIELMDIQLTLHDSFQSQISLQVIQLTLTQSDDTLSQCHLVFDVSPQLYQHIKTSALLNLKPDARNTQKAVNFQLTPNLQITASLHPKLLSELAAHATDNHQAATYLSQLNTTQPNHSFFSTDNWFALEVKQPQTNGEIGYRTLWNYLSPALLVRDNLSDTEVSAAILSYFQDWTKDNLPALAEEASADTFAEIAHSLEEFTDTQLNSLTEQAKSGFVGAMTNAFQQWADSTANKTPSPSIFQIVIEFFTKNDWSFLRLEGETILRLAFEGDNGQWKCYAKVREEHQQFIFYSICPINAPQEKCTAISEFISRANYGMTIGNFEIDFTDGEIRYKTGIDVEEDRLSFALVKRLVYTNVTTMDDYLPGIEAVIEGKMSPEEAIDFIEGKEASD